MTGRYVECLDADTGRTLWQVCFDSNSFQRIADAFLAQPSLPFAEVLSAERIARIFAKHGNLFGVGAIYSTAVMVWSFLGQVLRDGKEASCQSAVARLRVNLPWRVLSRIASNREPLRPPPTRAITANREPSYPNPPYVISLVKWLPIVSLATACLVDAAIGPYKGKQTGESALLRSILRSLLKGDLAVADR